MEEQMESKQSKGRKPQEKSDWMDTSLTVAKELAWATLQGAAFGLGGILLGRVVGALEPKAEVMPLRKVG